MGQDPDAIREEIEHTRREMGDTVDALGYKADIPSRAKENIAEKKDALLSKVTGAKSRVSDASPSTGDVKQRASKAKGIAQDNPLGLAVAGVAVGFLLGTLVPSTSVENEKLGPIADDVKQQAKETGHEAIERGKHVAQQAAESAKETAQQTGQEHAQELRGSAQEKAQEVQQSAQQASPS